VIGSFVLFTLKQVFNGDKSIRKFGSAEYIVVNYGFALNFMKARCYLLRRNCFSGSFSWTHGKIFVVVAFSCDLKTVWQTSYNMFHIVCDDQANASVVQVWKGWCSVLHVSDFVTYLHFSLLLAKAGWFCVMDLKIERSWNIAFTWNFLQCQNRTCCWLVSLNLFHILRRQGVTITPRWNGMPMYDFM